MKDKIIAALLAPTIIAMCLAIFYFVVPKSETALKPRVEAEPENWRHARAACKEAVKKRLHDPDSAEFGGRSDFHVAPTLDGYDVFTKVRARNGFNALRLEGYKCEIRQVQSLKNGGITWSSIVVKIQ